MKRIGAESFVRSQVWLLLTRMPSLVVVLSLASVFAGLAEAGILAAVAEAALLLANHGSAVTVGVQPVRFHVTLGTLLGLGVALAAVRLALGVVVSFVPARINDNTQARLRSSLFSAFSTASWEYQSRDREGHFQELVTNHVGQATQAFATAAQLITALLTFLVLVLSAVSLSPIAAIGIILIVGALSVVLRPLGNLGHRRARALSDGWLAYAAAVSEAVRLAEEAHIFGAEACQRQHLDGLIEAFRKPNLHSIWLANLVASVYQAFIYLILVLALIALDLLGADHISSLAVVVLMLVRSGSYGQQVQSALQSLRQAQPYVERLQDAERAYRASTPADGHQRLQSVKSLTFEAVSFAYASEQPVLKQIDFTVARGEAIGIVGATGVGKSTLTQVLLGLRTASSGAYLINGIPAREIVRQDWRRAFAYVPQDPRLLHASVGENIRFFRTISDEDVERAARFAGIHDEIVTWKAGYETVVGPRANAISGGQQQRVCLARAIAAKPEVLVLDEPTSALDPLTEQMIHQALSRLKGDVTLFVVAHRMATLDVCDRIMVIADGRLEAFEAAADLASRNGYYRAAVAASTTGGQGRR